MGKFSERIKNILKIPPQKLILRPFGNTINAKNKRAMALKYKRWKSEKTSASFSPTSDVNEFPDITTKLNQYEVILCTSSTRYCTAGSLDEYVKDKAFKYVIRLLKTAV